MGVGGGGWGGGGVRGGVGGEIAAVQLDLVIDVVCMSVLP